MYPSEEISNRVALCILISLETTTHFVDMSAVAMSLYEESPVKKNNWFILFDIKTYIVCFRYSLEIRVHLKSSHKIVNMNISE